jgi:hypothetical protein
MYSMAKEILQEQGEKMKVSLDEIKQAFDTVIAEKKSREEVASWAHQLQLAEDDNNLKYDPPSAEDKIWDGIEYLMGIDLRDADGSYLHSLESFIEYREKKGF